MSGLPPYVRGMARSLLAPPRRSTLDPCSESFRQDRGDELEQLTVLDDLLDRAAAWSSGSA